MIRAGRFSHGASPSELVHRRLRHPIAISPLAQQTRFQSGVLPIDALIVDIFGVAPEPRDRGDELLKALLRNPHLRHGRGGKLRNSETRWHRRDYWPKIWVSPRKFDRGITVAMTAGIAE